MTSMCVRKMVGYVTLPKEGVGQGFGRKIMKERKQNGKRKPKGKELNDR